MSLHVVDDEIVYDDSIQPFNFTTQLFNSKLLTSCSKWAYL